MLKELFAECGLNNHEVSTTLKALKGDDLDFYGSSAFEKLFCFFQYEMPYGVQKARTGDPIVWILDRLEYENESQVLSL